MQLAQKQFYQSIKKPINIIKGLGIVGLCSLLLSTCGSTYVDGFDVDFDRDEALIVVKNTDIFKKCIPKDGDDSKSEYFIGVSCVFNGKAPDEFNITYAVWLNDDEDMRLFYGKEIWSSDPELDESTYITIDGQSVSHDEWTKRGEINRKKAISELPKSAWKTYTVDTKSHLEKHKGMTPDGEPMGLTIPIGWGIFLPSALPSLQDRILNLDINIDKNGKVEVEDNYHWKNSLPSNPYA